MPKQKGKIYITPGFDPNSAVYQQLRADAQTLGTKQLGQLIVFRLAQFYQGQPPPPLPAVNEQRGEHRNANAVAVFDFWPEDDA